MPQQLTNAVSIPQSSGCPQCCIAALQKGFADQTLDRLRCRSSSAHAYNCLSVCITLRQQKLQLLQLSGLSGSYKSACEDVRPKTSYRRHSPSNSRITWEILRRFSSRFWVLCAHDHHCLDQHLDVCVSQSVLVNPTRTVLTAESH